VAAKAGECGRQEELVPAVAAEGAEEAAELR